jgi:phosphonate C-P lyase system protein PhnG
MDQSHTTVGPRDQRVEALAIAQPDALVAAARQVLEIADDLNILAGPSVGVVPLIVEEPVAGDRFIAAEVLATEVRIELDGTEAWAMRLGSDTVTTLAAAVIDAAAERDVLTAEIDELLTATRSRQQAELDERMAEVAPTEVRFEELL